MNRKETHSNHSEKNAGRGERGLGWYHACRLHQENPESASTKLEALATMVVPYKRFEALPVIDSQFQARRSS